MHVTVWHLEHDIWNYDPICWHSVFEETSLFCYLIAGVWEGIRRMKYLLVSGLLDKLYKFYYILKERKNLPHHPLVLFCCCCALIHFLNNSLIPLSIWCSWVVLSSLGNLMEAEMICNKNWRILKSCLYAHNVFPKSSYEFFSKFFRFSSGKRLFGTFKAVERRLRSSKHEEQGKKHDRWQSTGYDSGMLWSCVWLYVFRTPNHESI